MVESDAQNYKTTHPKIQNHEFSDSLVGEKARVIIYCFAPKEYCFFTGQAGTGGIYAAPTSDFQHTAEHAARVWFSAS